MCHLTHPCHVLDLVEQAHFTFEGAAGREIAFVALKGFLDVRHGARDGAGCAGFSWQGCDDNDPACGRGWVIIGTEARLVGHFLIHNADKSGFVCDRCDFFNSLLVANNRSDGPVPPSRQYLLSGFSAFRYPVEPVARVRAQDTIHVA
jgi:hypothetical protein